MEFGGDFVRARRAGSLRRDFRKGDGFSSVLPFPLSVSVGGVSRDGVEDDAPAASLGVMAEPDALPVLRFWPVLRLPRSKSRARFSSTSSSSSSLRCLVLGSGSTLRPPIPRKRVGCLDLYASLRHSMKAS